jgi:hypothetical protein
MNVVSTINRRMVTIALALFAILALASSTASAQSCGSCSGSDKYRIQFGNWPAKLGYGGVTISRVNRTTGNSTETTHPGFLQGDILDAQFFQSNPSSQWDVGYITLNTGLGTIVWVTCVNGTSECFYLQQGTQFACVKISFIKGIAGDPFCYKILIESVNCPCPQ